MADKVVSKLSTLFTKVPKVTPGSSVLRAPATRVTTLSNGLRVATEEGFSSNVATLGVYIDAGSRYETDTNNGVSKFAQHLLFQGTQKRGTQQLVRDVESLGGRMSANTTRDQTSFVATVGSSDVNKAVDILAEMLQNPAINDSAVDAERANIIKAAQESERKLEDVIFDKLHLTAYQTSSLGMPVYGSEATVSSLNKSQILDHIKSLYTADRMVLAATGDIKHDDLVKLAESAFNSLPKQGRTFDAPAKYIGSDIRILNDDMPLLHYAVGFEGPSYASSESFTFLVMQQLLGSYDITGGAGFNSTTSLPKKVAELKIAHTVQPFTTFYSDTSLFGCYAVCDTHEAENSTYTILDHMVRLCFVVSEDDLQIAKNRLKTSLLAQLDSNTSVVDDIGTQVLRHGRRLSPAEVCARVDAVTVKDVKSVAMSYIYDRDPVLSAYGPIVDLPDYNWLRSWSYWLKY